MCALPRWAPIPPSKPTAKWEDDDGRSRRPQVSHFETLIQLMLRRSPSARGGVMSRRGQCNDTEELRKR
jgi:hypothetical protein